MGLRAGGLSAPSNQLKAKSWRWMDGVWGRSFAVQHRRRFGCRNTSYGTVPKRQNPSKIHAQGAPHGFEDRGPFSTFEPAKSKALEMEMDGWGIEALPSSTVGESAAETPLRARFRTPARFMPKRCLMGLRTGGLSAPSNQLIAKSWREMDGWGIEALPSSTVGDSAAETPPRARFRNGRTPARFELRHSKKQYVRRVQNSTFGAP